MTDVMADCIRKGSGAPGARICVISPRTSRCTSSRTRRALSRSSTPVAYEVIRHRLQRIDEEHASTIVRVSGSQVVTLRHRTSTSSSPTRSATSSCVGTYVMWHGVILDMLIKEVLERRGGDDVGIHDGDMFLVNDPFLGAGHYNDVALLCPDLPRRTS